MTTENILFPRDHMATRDGYFYYFDERNNTLNERVSDGGTSFSYPVNPSIGTNQVDALEYDGTYFWSLQEGTTDEDVVLKKWRVDNYVCFLQDTISLVHTSEYKYSCPTFSLEYYDTVLTTDLPSHSSELSLATFTDKIFSGDVLTLGPNDSGQYEDVTVTGTLATPNTFGLDFYTKYTYESNDPVYFSKNIWLVNHYLNVVVGGSLHKIDIPSKTTTAIIEDTSMEYVEASCFYAGTSAQYMLFIIGNVTRFFNLTTLAVEKSMFIDNIKTDQTTLIPVYDIKVDNETLFRLQKGATYFGVDDSFSTFNIQYSPLRPFIDSVTIDVNPTILPSNGINVANIIALVKDQYAEPIALKPVTFTDTDSTGFMTITSTYTDYYGKALSYYKAGLSPALVTITVTATQYD